MPAKALRKLRRPSQMGLLLCYVTYVKYVSLQRVIKKLYLESKVDLKKIGRVFSPLDNPCAGSVVSGMESGRGRLQLGWGSQTLCTSQGQS